MIRKITAILLCFATITITLPINSCFAENTHYKEEVKSNEPEISPADEETINELIINIAKIKAELANSSNNKTEKKLLTTKLHNLEAQLKNLVGKNKSVNLTVLRNTNETLHKILSKLHDLGCNCAEFLYFIAKCVGTSVFYTSLALLILTSVGAVVRFASDENKKWSITDKEHGLFSKFNNQTLTMILKYLTNIISNTDVHLKIKV